MISQQKTIVTNNSGNTNDFDLVFLVLQKSVLIEKSFGKLYCGVLSKNMTLKDHQVKRWSRSKILTHFVILMSPFGL